MSGGFIVVQLFLEWNGKISPGKVFDPNLPLDQVADG
jgi:hypothetical protein